MFKAASLLPMLCEGVGDVSWESLETEMKIELCVFVCFKDAMVENVMFFVAFSYFFSNLSCVLLRQQLRLRSLHF